MSDRDATFFYDKGHDLANRAEHGDLSGVNKEIQDIRSQQHLKPSEYNALLNSIKGANTMDMHDEDKRVADHNQHKWFFQSDAKATLPQLIIDGADSKAPVAGYIGRDGLKQAEIEKPAPATPQKVASGEGAAIGFNAAMANKIFDDTVNPPKTH